jgi:glucosamine--fructose-6-phosphate aminotransferase (isomerizing)
LSLIALLLGRQRQLSLVMGQRIAGELLKLPDLVKLALAQDDKIKEIAKKYKDFDNFLYLGRKYNFPTALEGAIKLKEISYVHAEGYASGEMKHGPIAMISPSFPSVVICPTDSVYDKVVSSIEQIKCREGKVIAIATEGNEEIEKIADDVIYIPKTLEMLSPVLAVVPLQLLAYHIGVLKGHDVDKPRNLAKSVTVE